MPDNNWSVYVHINKRNGKKYVGITGKPVQERWDNGQGYHGQIFYDAIKKYGWDGFDHIILETGLTKEDAEKAEREYIKILMSHVNYWGYNVAWGGNASSSPGTKIYSFNLDGKYEKSFDLIADAADEYGLNSPNIVACCKGEYSHVEEHIFRYQCDVQDVNEFYKEIDPSIFDRYWQVYQFDFEKNLISEYKNASEASSQNSNWVSSSILYACRGNYKYAYGYLWEFKRNVPDLQEYKRIPVDLSRNTYKGESVIQFDLHGNYIKEFSCVSEASEEYNCSKCLISYACIGRTPTAVGYQWRYKKDYLGGNIEPYHRSNSLPEKPLAQYGIKDGKLIKTYRNPSEASRETGVPGKQIIDACNGKQKTAHGFIWKFFKDAPSPQIEAYPYGSKRLSPVIQMTIDGNFIAKYPSIKNASEKTGISIAAISDCCSKSSKTGGGFIWVREKDYKGGNGYGMD